MTTRTRIPTLPLREGPARSLGELVARAAQRALASLLRWQELARQRRSLQDLDDRLLKDIGLSRADVLREATRPFWDDPLR